MDFEFETTRTGLANAFAAAGAELLGYQPLVSAAVAAIPDTQPEKYAIAGTLPGILQMAGKMMGEEGDTGLEGLTRGFDYQSGLDIKAVLYSDTINDKQVCRDDLWLATTEALNSLSAGASPAAAEKPTGDLTDEQYQEILRPVLSRYGMQRYLNGDEITLDPSDYRAIIDRASDAAIAAHQSQQAEPKNGDDGYVCPAGRAQAASQEGAHAALDEVRLQWISTTERMPEDGQTVLISCPEPTPEVWEAKWRAGSRTFESKASGWVRGDEASHWTPLPPSPSFKTPACAERSGDRE